MGNSLAFFDVISYWDLIEDHMDAEAYIIDKLPAGLACEIMQ